MAGIFIFTGMPLRRIALSTDYTYRNKVRLVRGGHQYFDILENMIDRAEQSIHLQTYIYEDDKTGRRITEALKRAAQRGVKVFLLTDAFASKNLGQSFEEEMKIAGIQFRSFEPVMRSRYFYIGRRLHHKIVVTDAFYSLVAGVNISDRYNDLPDQPAWLDWAILAEGEVSYELFKVCLEIWHKSYSRAMQMVSDLKKHPLPDDWDCAVKVRRNDWVHHHNQISRSYIEMFNRAEERIIIMSSYFLPGRVFRRNIKKASARGVRISLMLAGKSDIALAKNAERFIYRWLLKNKIEIYEYPSKVLHGKISTYDNKWVTVGSYNVNNISAYASVELNLDVDNIEFARGVQLRLEEMIRDECIQVTGESYSTHNHFIQRMVQAISYEIVRLIVFLFTFYVRQR
jgi:cardiolipin synthase A/B